MKFSELFREIIGEQFPQVFLQVENDLLKYLKEFSLRKLKKTPNFLEQALNVFEDSYGVIIKKLADSFTDGLEAIGFSPVVTSRYFYAYFKEIAIEPELKTPDMWIDLRFRSFIQLILAEEWINFLADAPGNVIDKFPDFNIITPEVFEAANATRGTFPKVTQLARELITLRLICQDAKQIEEQLRLERVEENLQSLYFLAQILADMGELKRLNVPLIKKFVVSRQVIAQEVAQLLREPRLIFKKPEPLPKPPVEVNPFTFLNPVKEAKREGKITQNNDWGEILEEMDSSVGDLGKVLSTVEMPGGGRNSPRAVDNVTSMSPQSLSGKVEQGNQKTPEIHGKNDTKGKKTQMALMEEEFDLNARRDKLTEWLVRALPMATRYQMES